MSLKEHQNINDFISGLSDDHTREKIAEELNSKRNKREKEMKRSIQHNFDAQTAWTKLHDRLNDNGLIKSRRNKNLKLNYISRVAASIILILGLSVSAYYIFRTAQYTEIASANEIKKIYLPDGTLVTLNNNSVLKFPEEFSGDLREIEFEGEAFFEVRRMPEKPFIINTNDATAKVLGTSFNLNSRKKNTELTVTTGKVQLAKESNLSENVILEVGDKGLLINDKLSKEKNLDENYLSWKTKVFQYKNGVSLKQVFSELDEAYKNINIIIENDEINSLTISNNEFDNVELDSIFEIIFRIHPLKKKQKGNKIFISKEE